MAVDQRTLYRPMVGDRLDEVTISEIITSSLIGQDSASYLKRIYNTLIDVCIKRKIVSTPRELQIRAVMPVGDLAMANETFWLPAQTAAAWTNMITNRTVLGNQVMMFYGAATDIPTTDISALHFQEGTGGVATRAQFQIESIYSEESGLFFFQKPVIYYQDDVLSIRTYSRATFAANLYRFALKAVVGEPATFKML